ncbi:MAG TPA: hypothetical protein VKG38_20165 [Solirubrobacteraceae bacterium]|nr:hypothetical protein [Solirubrobacteraceae bacterium]
MTRLVAARVQAVILGALSVTLVMAAPAAAETVITFDTLTPGESVTTQYAGAGVLFGHAEEFGQPTFGAGDCGAPTVSDTLDPGFSAPNDALLTQCAPLGGDLAPAAGTFGQLTGTPTGSLSVEAVYPYDGEEALELKTYDSEGNEIGAEEGKSSGNYVEISVADLTNTPIAYFAMRSAGNEMIIDNFTFGTPSDCGGTNYTLCKSQALKGAKGMLKKAELGAKQSESKAAATAKTTYGQTKAQDHALRVEDDLVARNLFEQTKKTNPNAAMIYKQSKASDKANQTAADGAAKAEYKGAIAAGKAAEKIDIGKAVTRYKQTVAEIKSLKPTKGKTGA